MEFKYVYVFTLLMLCSCEPKKDVLTDVTTTTKGTKLLLGTSDKKVKGTSEKFEKISEKLKLGNSSLVDAKHNSSTHNGTADADVVNNENGTLCMKNLGTCQVKFHQHKLANGTLVEVVCPPDHALLKGLCSDEKHSCCVPSQKVRKAWNTTDQPCAGNFGVCKLNTDPCDGNYESDKCGGPPFRSCCLPNTTLWKDTKCSKAFGNCQLGSDPCKGKPVSDFCDGPSSRICCVPSNSTVNEWKLNEDLKCNNVWGTCQYKEDCSTGNAKSNLCGGPPARTCCLPDTKTIKSWSKKCVHNFGKCAMKTTCDSNSTESFTCGESNHHVCCVPNEKVQALWKVHDSPCLEVKGICQHKSLTCSNGAFEDAHSCGGPTDRACCVPKDHVHDDTECTGHGGHCQIKSEQCSGAYSNQLKCRGHSTRRCCVKITTTTSDHSHHNTKGKVNDATKHNSQSKASIVVPVLVGLIVVIVFLVLAQKKFCKNGINPYIRVKDKTSYETRGLLTSKPDADGKRDLQVHLSV